MAASAHKPTEPGQDQPGCVIVSPEANFGRPSQGGCEEMARRTHDQNCSNSGAYGPPRPPAHVRERFVRIASRETSGFSRSIVQRRATRGCFPLSRVLAKTQSVRPARPNGLVVRRQVRVCGFSPGFTVMRRPRASSRAKEHHPTEVSRTRLGLASGWVCPGRRLSRERGNLCRRRAPGRGRHRRPLPALVLAKF